jgi:hypothetical protein
MLLCGRLPPAGARACGAMTVSGAEEAAAKRRHAGAGHRARGRGRQRLAGAPEAPRLCACAGISLWSSVTVWAAAGRADVRETARAARPGGRGQPLAGSGGRRCSAVPPYQSSRAREQRRVLRQGHELPVAERPPPGGKFSARIRISATNGSVMVGPYVGDGKMPKSEMMKLKSRGRAAGWCACCDPPAGWTAAGAMADRTAPSGRRCRCRPQPARCPRVRRRCRARAGQDGCVCAASAGSSGHLLVHRPSRPGRRPRGR